MVRFLAAVTTIVVCAGGIACGPSSEEQAQAQMEAFRGLLPEPIRASFDAKAYGAAVQQIDSLLACDSAFVQRWAAFKKTQAMELFGTGEVVDYFVTYVVEYGKRR
jgi:hypothetical protein